MVIIKFPYPFIEPLRRLLKDFLVDMAYTPLEINPVNQELEDFLVRTMDSRNIRCQQLEKTVHLAASFIEVCFHVFSHIP